GEPGRARGRDELGQPALTTRERAGMICIVGELPRRTRGIEQDPVDPAVLNPSVGARMVSPSSSPLPRERPPFGAWPSTHSLVGKPQAFARQCRPRPPLSAGRGPRLEPGRPPF